MPHSFFPPTSPLGPAHPSPSAHTGRDPDDDGFHDECGVFGITGHPQAPLMTALGLHALQHRGEDAAGIVSFDGAHFCAERHIGHVSESFSHAAGALDRMSGESAIGHVRYPTAGDTGLRNVQPLYADLPTGGMAIAHNGNLTNANMLRRELVETGALFQSTSDTEVILHLVANSRARRLADRLADALTRVIGAYSLVCLTNKKLIGIRDPYGVRPLVLGRLDGATVMASETCALDIIGAQFVRDVLPGEMVVVESDGEPRSLFPFEKKPNRFCIFEFIYFSRPDSQVEGIGVYQARKRIGEELAREHPVEADIISPVPDSGVPAAVGYAQELNIPFDFGLIRNHYVGRSFIAATQASRRQKVLMKHNTNSPALKGQRVVLVDDSIVRGTTSVEIVRMVREAGAAEVHMRIASPPTRGPCYYGINTPQREELMAANMNEREMAEHIGADSLGFLSLDGLYRAVGEDRRNNEKPQYCDACFSDDYPIEAVDRKAAGGKDPQLSFLSGAEG